MAGLLGHHYEHYPNQMRFLIKINRTADIAHMTIGEDLYDICLSLDDILYILEQHKIRGIGSLLEHLILTDDISKTNDKYIMNSYVNVNIRSLHDELCYRYLDIRIDDIHITISTVPTQELHITDGLIQLNNRTGYDNIYTRDRQNNMTPIQSDHNPLAWHFYTALIDKYTV